MAVMRTIRAFLVVQVALFLSAASIHFGLLFGGYQHRAAGTAESVIAVVLLAGLAATWLPGQWSRWAAIAAQAFGLFGTLVGLFTIAIGVGPRTALDLAYHASMLAALIWGLVVAVRPRTSPVRA